MANSVAVFRELSWLTRRVAEVKLDRKAAGLGKSKPVAVRSLGKWANLSSLENGLLKHQERLVVAEEQNLRT